MATDATERVAEFVRKKLGKVISDRLRRDITGEDDDFDVDGYATELFDRFFTETEIERVKNKVVGSSEPDNSDGDGDDEYEQEPELELEEDEVSSQRQGSQSPEALLELDFHPIAPEDIVPNLQSDSLDVRVKCLRDMEMCADDLINQSSWMDIKKILQNFLEEGDDEETRHRTLRLFRKFLFSPHKPQLVSEAFISLAEIVAFHVDAINSDESGERDDCRRQAVTVDLLLRSMWLLTMCQRQMPEKWTRFSHKRLREIVFAFVHLLSVTTSRENEELTGLELLSLLNPTGTWCRHWCHTATGRSLLCSALRKYKQFFVTVVEVILSNLKRRKSIRLQPIQVGNRRTSADWLLPAGPRDKSPMTPTRSSRPPPGRPRLPVGDVPRRVSDQATFCHSLTLVVLLIQYRSGRSLFPVQTSSMKRSLTVSDLVSSAVDFLTGLESSDEVDEGVPLTPAYRHHMVELLDMLRTVQTKPFSSRKSTSRPEWPPR